MSKPSIAVLGTGLMGAPMAANLLKAGFPVTAWNRTLAKAEALVPLGAKLAPSAAAAAKGAEIVITMLENGPVVEETLFGAGAVATSLARGSLVMDMSSIEPSRAREHGAKLAALGIGYLDAPVSGGTGGARDATLAIMAGGSAEDFERTKPVMQAMGRPTHVGPAGSGQLAKLCNQTIVSVTVAVVAEALLLAAAGGADPAAVRQAMSGGYADSKVLQLQGQQMLDRNFMPRGPARMVLKDSKNILDTARELGLTLPLAKCASDIFNGLAAHGGINYDHTAVLLELERMNGGKRVGSKPDQLPS
ncbi:MAG TPA: NAD(P)-dependent oxidoreductase [Stellaceae bacterium]|nr:NAD(P)-dependent oxidoreductase [Stellaceae bacterium]